jgi:hypothetical protein
MQAELLLAPGAEVSRLQTALQKMEEKRTEEPKYQ